MASNNPIRELLEQVKTQAVTANSLSQQIATNTKQSAVMLQKIDTVFTNMSGGMGAGGAGGGMPMLPGYGGGGYGGGGYGGPGYGGPGYGGGPNGGRPILMPNQSQRGYATPQGYPGGNGYGMGYGMGGMLGYVQSAAAQAMHSGLGAGQGGAVNYERRTDPQTGVSTNHPINAQGQVSPTGISDQTMKRRDQVSTAAGQVGSSGSIMGAVHGALGAIPVIGPALQAGFGLLDAPEKLGNFIGDQRAANAQYQAIYGPGTSGFDQRMHEFGGGFRNTMSNLGSAFGIGSGGLSSSDYDKTFKGISAMGYQGGTRNNMINFAKKNFNNEGMSVDQSMELIGINAKMAGTSLSTLSEELKNVSAMAQQAGQSGEVFRQKFTQSYAAAVNAGFGGSSGPTAMAQVASTAGQGRAFASYDTSSMYSTLPAQQILASNMGMSNPLDFALAARNDPTFVATAQQKWLNPLMEAAVSPEIRKWVEQEIPKHGGAQVVGINSSAAAAVVAAVEQAHPKSLGDNWYAIASAMKTAMITSVDLNDSVAVAAYYVGWVAKQGKNFTDPAKAAQKAAERQVGTPAAKLAQAKSAVKQAMGGPADLGVTTVGGKAATDPGISGAQGKVGYVTVNTAKGEQITVSLADAARDYRSQLRDGTAIIADGPDQGSTFGTVYGQETNVKPPTVDPKLDERHAKADAVFDSKVTKGIQGLGLTGDQMTQLIRDKKFTSKLGSKSDDALIAIAQEMVAKAAAATGGTVTLGLTPEAAKLVVPVSSTGVVQTTATGSTPANDPNGATKKPGQ